MKAFDFLPKKATGMALGLMLAVLFCAPAYAAGGHWHAQHWVSTDFWRIMNFLVLLAALVYLFKKVGTPALNKRITDIEQDLKNLEAKKEAAARDLLAMEKRLVGLEEEARRVVDDYVRQGEAARDKILAEAAHAADRLQEQAQRHMAHELKQAQDRLKEQMLAKAVALGEKLIKDNINEADQQRLVDEYLDKVVAQ
jgi:F-type H+-transporting ATPase subunit b